MWLRGEGVGIDWWRGSGLERERHDCMIERGVWGFGSIERLVGH